MGMNKKEILMMQIKRVEKEIRDTPYHKGTEHYVGKLRAKLSRLREQAEGGVRKGGGGGLGYATKKEGDATVVLVGPPSVGKSTLLNALTNAQSRVAEYDFTTIGVIPGMMEYQGARIQLLDLPGLILGAASGSGMGRRVLSVVRTADLVITVTDWQKKKEAEEIEKELYRVGIRLGEKPAKISIEKKERGAVRVIDRLGNFEPETVVQVAEEFGFRNVEVQIREKVSLDQLIDAFAGNRRYLPVLRVVNKADELKRKKGGVWPGALFLSAKENQGLELLRKKIWEGLGLVRVYLRPDKRKSAKGVLPFIARRDDNLEKVLKKVSTEMLGDVGRAFIWGSEARFPGQQVSFSRLVFDEMEVYFARRVKN